MAKDDELEARERIARNLLASVGRKDCETMDERDLARNAAQAIWLRDERIRTLEAWLKAEVDDEIGPEDIVRHLLPEGADIASVKRAYEVGGVQFHRLGVDQKADPFLGQNEERDRLARAFEALLRLDQEVQHRAKAIFSANHLGDHGFSASVTFTYDPVRDKAKG